VNDHPAHSSSQVAAITTIGQVIGDLVKIAERLPTAGDQTGKLAGILEHLADEIAEAAAMLRGDPEARPRQDPGPGVAMPGGQWLSGPMLPG
jgi:hypothetical protein